MTPTASQLTVRALGLAKPAGGRAVDHATHCSLCGVRLGPGELAFGDLFGNSFMDDFSLAARTGVACQYCYAVAGKGSKPVMFALMGVVVTANGVYPIRTDRHRTWFLLTPPEPPFVAMVGLTTLQHLVWRTPVTVDRQLITVRLGENLVTIRHTYLMQAVAACRRAGSRLTAHVASNSKRTREKAYPHPFVALHREAKDCMHGVLRPDAVAFAANDPELANDLALLAGCTQGELWALATLAKTTPEEPEQPEPSVLTLTTNH